MRGNERFFLGDAVTQLGDLNLWSIAEPLPLVRSEFSSSAHSVKAIVGLAKLNGEHVVLQCQLLQRGALKHTFRTKESLQDQGHITFKRAGQQEKH